MDNAKTIVVNYLGRKGAGPIYSYEMAKSLKLNGCIVYAVISAYSENLDAWKKLGLDGLYIIKTYTNVLSYILNTILFRLFGILKLNKFFKRIKVDAIYAPMPHSWTYIVNSAFPNSQKILTIHDPILHSGTNLFIKLRNTSTKIINDIDDIVILSEKFRGYVKQRYRKSDQRVHTIPHGVFDYYKKVESNEEIFAYDNNKMNFLFFGRITKYKGLHILAESYKEISKEFDDVTLTIVGSGDFSEYKEYFHNLKNVTIVNRWIKDEEVGSFFKGSNLITILPYIDATQSGVIPVAMEYCSIVIASNTGGLSEQVKDKETGLLFEPGNSQDLYNKMKFIIINYKDLEYIKHNAKQYISSLSWDKLGLKLINIIR